MAICHRERGKTHLAGAFKQAGAPACAPRRWGSLGSAKGAKWRCRQQASRQATFQSLSAPSLRRAHMGVILPKPAAQVGPTMVVTLGLGLPKPAAQVGPFGRDSRPRPAKAWEGRPTRS
jgi:hypothetical protein